MATKHYDPKQDLLFISTPHDALPEDHLCYFIDEVVEKLDFSSLPDRPRKPECAPKATGRSILRSLDHAHARTHGLRRRKAYIPRTVQDDRADVRMDEMGDRIRPLPLTRQRRRAHRIPFALDRPQHQADRKAHENIQPRRSKKSACTTHNRRCPQRQADSQRIHDKTIVPNPAPSQSRSLHRSNMRRCRTVSRRAH